MRTEYRILDAEKVDLDMFAMLLVWLWNSTCRDNFSGRSLELQIYVKALVYPTAKLQRGPRAAIGGLRRVIVQPETSPDADTGLQFSFDKQAVYTS